MSECCLLVANVKSTAEDACNYLILMATRGLVGVGGFISATDVRELVEAGSMNFLFGGNGFFGYFFSDTAASSPHRQSPYHLSEPGESLAWWSTYAVDQCPSPSTMDLHDVLRQLRHRHQDWTDPVVQTILQHLRVDNMYPTWTVPPLPTWERDGVILVGDAAHALPPTSGQGSSQALEDAEALALLLSHHLQKANTEDGDASTRQRHAVRLAAKQYVDLRFPRVTKILRNAQSSQDSKRQKGTVEEYLMYAFMWILGMYEPIFLLSRIRILTTQRIFPILGSKAAENRLRL